MDDPATEWKTAVSKDELKNGVPLLVDLDDVPTLMYRSGDEIYTLSNRCTHAGGPPNEGEFDESRKGGPCVKCPLHQSVFRLKDGAGVHWPAAVRQPTFDMQATGDKIEVRLPANDGAISSANAPLEVQYRSVRDVDGGDWRFGRSRPVVVSGAFDVPLDVLAFDHPRVGPPPSGRVEPLEEQLDRVAPVVVSGLRGKNRVPVQQSDA